MPSLQNQVAGQQLSFTQGDNVTLALLAVDSSGLPVNLTGASIATDLLGANSVGEITFGNAHVTLGNQSTAPGTFSVALSPTESATVGEGLNKDILCVVTISAVQTTYRGINLLNVYSPVPAQ